MGNPSCEKAFNVLGTYGSTFGISGNNRTMMIGEGTEDAPRVTEVGCKGSCKREESNAEQLRNA